MQFPGQGKPPLGVVFDCDMGNSIDDALAMAMLYGLDGKNEARVISISVSKANLHAAALCETIGRFYAGAVSGEFAGVGRTLPIGLAVDGLMPEDTPMLLVPLDKKNPDGTPVYHHGIHKLNDTAEVPALIRNALTSQQDGNCIVVVTGPANNLASMLKLPGIKELIARKVRYLVIMGGTYPEGGPEYNIKADIASARKLFSEWPTPIVATGFEVGEKLLYPAASIEKDFAWTPNHPVVDAYRAYNKMPYDAETWDLTAVLYAIRPNEGYFKLSDPGTIVVLEDGRTKFTASTTGKHRYLIFDPSQKERIVKTYIELASAQPVKRVRRFRPPQDDEKKKTDPPKPPGAKQDETKPAAKER